MKQYYFLVCLEYCGYLDPIFVSLNEKLAIKRGRRKATELAEKGYKVKLFHQEITNTGKVEFVKILKPYEKTENK